MVNFDTTKTSIYIPRVDYTITWDDTHGATFQTLPFIRTDSKDYDSY